jgi:hypothetical protein
VPPPFGIPGHPEPAPASIMFNVVRTIRTFLQRQNVISAFFAANTLCCKYALNVFNKIQALFSAFVGADPLLSTLSKLFFTKTGG